MMGFHKIGFIGLGLMGGSIAMRAKKEWPELQIIATAHRESTVKEAFRMGVIDNDSLLPLNAFSDCDYIFLCAPTQSNIAYLKELKPLIKSHTMITDIGSTKSDIHEEVEKLEMGANFIGGHPMTGSEKTGIENASEYLLENAYYLITPTPLTPVQTIKEFREFAAGLGAIPLVLDYKRHDRATAAVSHLPHMIAFALANMVREEDDSEELMRRLAAGSFRDMTRVAASSPVMWQNICFSNRDRLLEMMDEYERRFHEIRSMVENMDEQGLLDNFAQAKDYRESMVIPKATKTRSVHQFYVDLIDETGSIAIISSVLAFRGISIRNIGIIHNREFGEGVLLLEFYTAEAKKLAIDELTRKGYTIHPG